MIETVLLAVFIIVFCLDCVGNILYVRTRDRYIQVLLEQNRALDALLLEIKKEEEES